LYTSVFRNIYSIREGNIETPAFERNDSISTAMRLFFRSSIETYHMYEMESSADALSQCCLILCLPGGYSGRLRDVTTVLSALCSAV